MLDTVLRKGWRVISVMASGECGCADCADDVPVDDDDKDPAFAYTIGLTHRVGHPELLISGLPHEVMQQVLDTIAARVLAGTRLVPGDVIEGALTGVPVVLEQVSHAAAVQFVRWACWFHRRDVEALAIVWPTESGRFRWQPGAPVPDLDEAQPPLWRVPFEHQGALAVEPPWPFSVPAEESVISCGHVVDLHVPVCQASRPSLALAPIPDRLTPQHVQMAKSGARAGTIRCGRRFAQLR